MRPYFADEAHNAQGPTAVSVIADCGSEQGRADAEAMNLPAPGFIAFGRRSDLITCPLAI